tara:strand:+ start:231 stop:917 length:687 start_codon:yes stop_codon:yes gene_type:complete
MQTDNERFEHLINNLQRITYEESIFNYTSGQKAFLSLGKGNIHEWLETLLPNTRLILEPKIIGSKIGIQYMNGKLNKAINENSVDITEAVRYVSSIPNNLQINKRIEIQGVLYDDKNTTDKNKKKKYLEIDHAQTAPKEQNFCAFHIFHCKINQCQALQELKKLNFEVPQTELTKYISDIEIYRQCWKEGKLFKTYPANGIVLKINSRKLQKFLGENNLSIHWAYSIN